MAGGEGQRLRPLTYYIQKAMIPIGPSQKPLLEYILRHLAYHGITDVIIAVGYKAEQIINYFGEGSSLSLKLRYCHDVQGLKGSGHALHNIYKAGFVSSDETLLIYYGDILSSIDIGEMMRQHADSGADVTLAASRKYQLPVGVVETDSEGRVARLREKPYLSLPVSIGILALEGRCLEVLTELARNYDEIDIMTHLIPSLIEKNYLVRMYETEAFWYDVGSTEKYEKLTADIIQKHLKHLEDFIQRPKP